MGVMRRMNDALNKTLKGPGTTARLGAILVGAGVAIFLVVRYWWAVLVVGLLLMAAAALGWLALDSGHIRKDFEKGLRRLRMELTG